MFALAISIPSYPPAHQHPHPEQAADCRPPQKNRGFLSMEIPIPGISSMVQYEW
jgi:hypothetical protein